MTHAGEWVTIGPVDEFFPRRGTRLVSGLSGPSNPDKSASLMLCWRRAAGFCTLPAGQRLVLKCHGGTRRIQPYNAWRRHLQLYALNCKRELLTRSSGGSAF